MATCMVMLRVKDNTRCRTHRNGKPRKKGASTGQAAEKRGGKRAAMTCCNTSQGKAGTHRSGATRANNCPHPKEGILNTGFPMPFRRSLMLRTCERASSAGTINAPSSSPSGKRNLSCSAKNYHKGATCFPISQSSSDLDCRTVIVVLAQQNGLSISWRIPSSLDRTTRS